MRKTKTTAAPKADPQNKELVEAIRALCQEKDLSEDMLFATVEDALKKAYAKNRAKGEAEPSANNISATNDRATGEIHVYTRRLIVEEVEKPADQISLEEARAIKDSYQMGDIVETDVTPRNFLRVAAQTAKGVIMQRLRDAERGRVYEEYADKENEILTAVVTRVDDKGAVVELMGRTEGYLERDQMIPGEVINMGDHLKVYVLEVQRGVDLTAFVGTFGILVEVVAAHLEQIRHAAQFFQIQMQAVTIQCHLTDIGTQAADAHAQHFLINAVLLGFCGSQDNDFIPLFLHRASPSLS